MDKSKPIAVAFLDLAKAFDTVNHKILLHKLYYYGIRGMAYKLMENYLTNRQQRVKIRNNVSSFSNINTGVPQSTILGPLLFILYVNDMFKENIISYADDTAIIITGDTWHTVEKKMNEELEKVSDWLALNKLSLNIKKTTYITFGNYCDSVLTNFDVLINGKRINRVESSKYLGIIIDYRLNWENHIKYIVGNTKYLIFVFYKLSKIINIETLRMIYFALFNSIISYGIIAWGNAYSNTLNILKNLQRKPKKIINKNKFIAHSNLPNIEQLYAIESLNIHYDNLKCQFVNSKSITRNNSILIPIRQKAVSNKCS